MLRPARLIVEIPRVDVHERDEPDVVVGLFDADLLAGNTCLTLTLRRWSRRPLHLNPSHVGRPDRDHVEEFCAAADAGAHDPATSSRRMARFPRACLSLSSSRWKPGQARDGGCIHPQFRANELA